MGRHRSGQAARPGADRHDHRHTHTRGRPSPRLGEHVQVVTGTGDTSSAGIGSGAVRDLDGHIYIGTSSWLSCHVPFKSTDVLHNITSLPSGIPNRYWVATEQDVAGGSLTWLVDNMLLADDCLSVVDAPEDMLVALNELAATSPPGSNGVIFFPWLNGERTPVDDHRIRGGWIDLGLGTKRTDLVRAVFEGVALNARWMLVYAEKFTKHRFDASDLHRWRRAVEPCGARSSRTCSTDPSGRRRRRGRRTCAALRSAPRSRWASYVGTTSRARSRSARPTNPIGPTADLRHVVRRLHRLLQEEQGHLRQALEVRPALTGHPSLPSRHRGTMAA